MRGFMLSCLVSCVVLLPTVGTAQVYSLPTPPPAVNAANANWQINGAPIFHAGNFYYPTGPTIYFDGNVMVRTGIYEGVPLYADSTLEPWSLVYVPIGGNVMRPYERLRAGDVAGTSGSRTPSFPVPPATASTALANIGTVIPESQRGVGTGGAIVNSVPPASPAPAANPRGITVQTIPAPTSNEGVWINFNGSRWYLVGGPVSHTPDRFEPAGSYRGFPVYREKNGQQELIYVAAMPDGPLVPYSSKR